MERAEKPKPKEIPNVITDVKNRKTYIKGRFLGKGGFARCWELIDKDTHVKYAGKVVCKADLVKPSQKQKMQQEIIIHSSLKHENIVNFHRSFDDSSNIYILLELCTRRTLMELHKRRRHITEPEARYFVRQTVNGCQYLHLNNIIHRDLKLANLFLSDEMVIKIGDFGLACKLSNEGEKKRTLCGTPNYIAPEILTKHGHSFEVDSWSIGCILYTLLVGRPPFETSNLKETYERIKKNEYLIPPGVSVPASRLIRALLDADPSKRPSMFSVIEHEFFKGFTPNCLPVSALTTSPRFDNLCRNLTERKPLSAIDANLNVSAVHVDANRDCDSDDFWLSSLQKKINEVITAPKAARNSLKAMEDSEDPACIPIYWVSKWVDYSDKYGIGYHLCDSSNGVLFNDGTRLLLTANSENLQYIDKSGTEYLYTMVDYPNSLAKKVTLLKCFTSYMHENLLNVSLIDFLCFDASATGFHPQKTVYLLQNINFISPVNFLKTGRSTPVGRRPVSLFYGSPSYIPFPYPRSEFVY
ncbi:unnamed protein product [Dibothriocephalus latus]|uniref:Serine/threonine-protein kinase PLK n=1 Tax=Dibothriocephalus latus TaxID=60516 RepID=A0A3P7MQC3_DIBLA|nr:unnamed protein product [Dibothriocephalus latus]